MDCLNGFGVNILGHNHKILTEAGIEFFEKKYPFQILDKMSSIRKEYIEILFSIFSENMKNNVRIQFAGGSGSDAVETALELAKKYTGRDIIAGFSGCYHGLTSGSMEITGNECDKYGNSHCNIIHFPFPDENNSVFGKDEKNDVELILKYIENSLDDPKKGYTKPAAFIMEVVQSDGGINIAPLQFVKEIRRITQERNILLIIDEVQTGFCKTGSYFGFQQYDIEPDIIVLSKALGAGMPLSAIIFKNEIDIPCSHGTFRGNQIAMYLGKKQLEYIIKNKINQHVLSIESYLKNKTNCIIQNFKCVRQIKIKGILMAIDFYNEKTNNLDPEKANVVYKECFRNKLLCKLGGRHNASLIFFMSLLITYDEIDELINIITHSII